MNVLRLIILFSLSLCVCSCTINTDKYYISSTDNTYLNRGIEITDLNMKGDVENDVKLEPHLIHENILYYSISTPPVNFWHTRSRVETFNQLNLTDFSKTETSIHKFAGIHSLEKVENDTYAIVFYDTFSEIDPYTVKVIMNWQTNYEVVLDEYQIYRKDLASKFARVGDILFYTKLNDLEIVELMMIKNQEAQQIPIDIDEQLLLPFSVNIISNHNIIAFTLIDDYYYEDGYYHTTLFYYYNNQWRKIVKENSYLFSAVPIKNKILIDEILPDDRTQYHWFDPDTKTFESVEIPGAFQTHRQIYLDDNSLLSVNEKFELILFEVDEQYKIHKKIISDETHFSAVRALYKESDFSVIAYVTDIVGFDGKLIRIKFKE